MLTSPQPALQLELKEKNSLLETIQSSSHSPYATIAGLQLSLNQLKDTTGAALQLELADKNLQLKATRMKLASLQVEFNVRYVCVGIILFCVDIYVPQKTF
jgi:hypothetical protein